MNTPAKSASYPDALQVALRYVSFKPRTVAEVRRRVGRDFDWPVVEQVLASLKRYGHLDDAEFATQWRSSRDRRKPRGAFLIRRELRTKGIPKTSSTMPWWAWTKPTLLFAPGNAAPVVGCPATRFPMRPSDAGCGTTSSAAASPLA